MRKIFFPLVLFVALQTASAQSPLAVQTFTLDNGLTVWLNEDRTQTTVFGAVVVRAGSKDSPGTGISHYLEHLLFKGTQTIGTINFEAERVFLDSIAYQYSLLMLTNDATERREIQTEINRLSILAGNYAIPGEFSNLIERMGGSGLNAGAGFDHTFYFNSFVPHYINQWLELNSERFINPVFRLFQSELEVVYEEKNMYNNISFMVAMQQVLERVFAPHPYQYPIIGLSEHLRNPDLEAMQRFFDEFYVAGNMALILSGDFCSEEIMPMITKHFGRLPAGNAPERPVFEIPPFDGRETMRVSLPIPLVKISANIWRGIPHGSPDENALNAVMRLLSNSNQTGYLDMLGTDGRVLMAGAMNLQLNDAGAVMVLTIPRLFFQSYRRAERLVMNEIERIRKGDFTDEDLESVKLELRREFELSLETLHRRAFLMIELFSAGRSWDDYLQMMYSIEALTREDIIETANRIFTENQLAVRKRFGRNRVENLESPGFAPILPPNRNERSEFAQRIIEEAEANPVVRPRTLDFENDAQRVEITPLVTLYASENPINSVFRLRLNYHKGNFRNNMIGHMSTFLNELATDSLSRRDFQNGLRRLGGTVYFFSNNDAFTVSIQGFDENIEPILRYVSHFMEQAIPNRNAFRRIVSAQRINGRAIRNEPMIIADALFNYVAHGQHSTFLPEPSVREVRRKGGDGLLDLFHEVIQTEVDIHYSGNLPVEEIKALVVRYFNPESVVNQAGNPILLPLVQHDRPLVFVIDQPRARQAIIYAYTFTPTPADYDFYNASRIFNAYFGGGINSLMFQEIREFRSFAYFASSRFVSPGLVNKNNGSFLMSQLTTSSDKITDAIAVLDSLLTNMPMYPERIAGAKQSLRNDISNHFPSFRNISEHIASQKRQGFSQCINAVLLDALDEMDMDSIVDFYNRNVRDAVTVYVVVGNMRQVDMEKLAQFGEVRRMRVRDIVR